MANVVFASKNAVKVRYVMLYMDGKLGDDDLAGQSQRQVLIRPTELAGGPS